MLIKKILPNLERVLLAILAFGFILQLSGMNIPVLISIGLGGLAVVFFLNGYIPVDIQQSEGEPMGFNELLGLSIVPKILWISAAVTTIGILFYSLQIGNDSYSKMLQIGGSTIVIGTSILLALKVRGVKNINLVLPVLLRALPALIIAGYILFG